MAEASRRLRASALARTQINVRVRKDWLATFDRLAGALSPGDGAELTRTDAVRMCLARGIESYERELGIIEAVRRTAGRREARAVERREGSTNASLRNRKKKGKVR